MSSTRSPATDWVAGLSPWPEEFGLDRMRALLAELGDPQLTYPSIHVVGTNGKSTTTRMIAALLRAKGLRVGAYTSPHVSGWHERLDTDPDGFERAVARVRPAAERLGATQFETLTAAALKEFEGSDAAVVEAGLGGRLDATNVLRAPVVVLTNVGLEHTDVLGETREEIAREKLAVARDGATVVLCEPEWQELVSPTVLTGRSNLALAVAAAETFLGDTVDPAAAEGLSLPGRFERVSESRSRSTTARTPSTASAGSCRDCPTAVTSSSPRFCGTRTPTGCSRRSRPWAIPSSRRSRRTSAPCPPTNLQRLGVDGSRERRRWRPRRKRSDAHASSRASDGAVLVTGSLYLLADLAARREDVPSSTDRDSASTSSPRS